MTSESTTNVTRESSPAPVSIQPPPAPVEPCSLVGDVGGDMGDIGDDMVSDDVLIEEVSIDGMCGVY